MVSELGHGRRRFPGLRRTSRFLTPGSALRFWLSPQAGSSPCRSSVFSRIVSAAAWRRSLVVLRSPPRSAAIGFAPSLEILSVTVFLAGITSGVMDVAMNANASDVERRSGRPLMSSFHAAFSLGGAAGALLGGWLGARGNGFGTSRSRSPLVVARRPRRLRSSCAKAAASGGAGFAVPNRRLLPLAVLAFVLMGTEGAVGDWSGTYLARSGVDPGRHRSRLCGLFAI